MSVTARLVWLAAMLAMAAPGQIPMTRPPAAQAAAQPAGDPLKRDTPRSSLIGFLEAAQAGRYRRAAQFLQMKDLERHEKGEEAAEQMASILSVQFKTPVEEISDEPDGLIEEGRSDEREVVGYLGTADEPVPLVLVRIRADDERKIWLISADTLAKLPALYAQVGSTIVWFHLPDWAQQRWLGMRIWQWLALPALLPPALLIAWVLLIVLRMPYWIYCRVRRREGGRWWKAAPQNLVCFTVWIHYVLVSKAALPVLAREHHGHIARGAIFVWVLWWMWHFANSALTRARENAMATSRTAKGSLIQLSQRVLKAILAVIIIMVMLSMLGFDMSTAVAGIGIGGIAIALAAQKTIENLFGGISLATDKVIRVGDMCRFGADQGWVEDIGIRSTRVRSLEGTELSIPNAALSMMTLENFSMRDRFRFFTTVALRYETTAAQLREITEGILAMLKKHPWVSPEQLRVRLRSFGASSLDVEIHAFVLTDDLQDFGAVREQFLLGIMEIVEKSGTGFAFPSQTLYITKDSAPSPLIGTGAQDLGGE